MVDKTWFITGCGTAAKALAKHILLYLRPKKIILFSRDEYLQAEAEAEIVDPQKRCRWFIGDIRDAERLDMAMRNDDIDVVIHTAALKRVDAIEYNPIEAVKTNVYGTMNVIEACVEHKVKKAVFLSTDKAVMPINLYGGTKFVGEKLWIHSNFYAPIFNVVRYGNVMGSRGSVLPFFRKELSAGKKELPITHEGMTRFWMDIEDAVKLVMVAAKLDGGYTVVAKCKAFRIVDLAKALYARVHINVVGLRPGEKIHETLIHEREAERTIEEAGYYKIIPELEYIERKELRPKGIAPLTSDAYELSIADLREKVK